MAVIPFQPTYSVQPKHGFRYAAQPAVANVAPAAPPKVGLDGSKAAAPPVMDKPQATYMSDPFEGNDFQQTNNTGVAQKLGYQQPASNIAGGIGTVLGAMAGIPMVGSALGSASEKLDQSGKPAYGTEGTYDAQGNIFGSEGRAYDPITGSAVASYKDKSSALNTVTDSYGNLREAGENPVSSALGSYDNSVYNVSRADRMSGVTPSGQAGLRSTYSLMRDNTRGEAYGDDFNEITPDMLGFGNERDYGIPETGLTGEIGSDAGDVFISGDSYQPYVVSDSGSLTGKSGTLVQTSDPLTGQSVSMFSKNDDGDGYTTAGSASKAADIQKNAAVKSSMDYVQSGYEEASGTGNNDEPSGGK